MQTAEAYARCLALTRAHYENFPVARMVPRRLQPAVAAVYAFARTADDIADEGVDRPGGPILSIDERLTRLRDFEQALLADNPAKSPPEWEWIFTAVADTRKQYDVPASLFQDLLSAFTQDVTVKRYATFADVLDYCRRSANPVGRLVLLLHGFRDETRFAQSDAICTALQLANFWQDVAVDWKKGRVYVPQEDWAKFGVTEQDFATAAASPGFRACLKDQVARTYLLFAQGRPLPASLPFPLSLEIRITWLGGSAILDAVVAQDYDTLRKRPAIGPWDKLRLLGRGLFPL
ncbi:MAG TPA: squalene synthase HpnC [Opitutales bacterium]|nr:squalene synthase HpnC [Opitutales bacterium]